MGEPTDDVAPTSYTVPLTEADRIRHVCLSNLMDVESHVRRGVTRDELLRMLAGAYVRVERQT